MSHLSKFKVHIQPILLVHGTAFCDTAVHTALGNAGLLHLGGNTGLGSCKPLSHISVNE